MHRQEKLARIQSLTRASTMAREVLARDVAVLRDQLDVPKRMKSSLKTNPMPWLGGSAVLGLITSRLFKRRRKAKARRREPESHLETATRGGVFVSLLGLLISTLRPVAQRWATQRVKVYLGDRMRYGSTRHPQDTNFRPTNPL